MQAIINLFLAAILSAGSALLVDAGLAPVALVVFTLAVGNIAAAAAGAGWRV